MSIPAIILLVFIAIVAVLLVLIVLLQNEEGDGLGGLFGGGSNSAFGPRSGNVLTRITSVLAFLFFGMIALFAYIQVPKSVDIQENIDLRTYSEKIEEINSSVSSEDEALKVEASELDATIDSSDKEDETDVVTQ